MEGDDPTTLTIYSLGLSHASALPYHGRYPAGSLVHNGVWYYGTYFERTNTWWKQSKAWISYITRAQQVLQQGRFVADIALIADEGMPSHGIYRPDIKLKGYDYDIISAAHVPNFQYENNEFVLPSGARYKAMIFPESEHLTLSTLEKIKELTEAGATVIAPRLIASPSISDSDDLKKYEDITSCKTLKLHLIKIAFWKKT